MVLAIAVDLALASGRDQGAMELVFDTSTTGDVGEITLGETARGG